VPRASLRESSALAILKGMESSARGIDELGLLDDLKQVPGVLGSLLVGFDGELLQQRLPPPWASRADAAGPRLCVLLDALAAGRAFQTFCLRFFEHRLHVLPTPTGFLCVLSELHCPAAVLKMAMNATARRLT
jgi:hypothetical protein